MLMWSQTFVSAAPPDSWQADPQRVAAAETESKGFNFREADVPPYTLPDPLRSIDGRLVATPAEWESARRAELLDLFSGHIYGRSPKAPARVEFEVLSSEPNALGGKATWNQVRIVAFGAEGKSFAFEAAVFLPNATREPVPALLLINNRGVRAADPSRESKSGFWPVEEIIARGFATAVIRTADVDPDDPKPESRAQGVRGVWPDGGGSTDTGDAWASLSAWAWAASRVQDYFQSEPRINASRVGVVGHSRGGKAALWAGAQDQRFALTISNESGEGGASLARRRFGETVLRSNTAFPHWYAANYKNYSEKESELPVDQHELIALLAPRAAYIASAGDDLWSDPRGEFLSLASAKPVYALYGLAGFDSEDMPALDTPVIRGKVGYHIQSGKHDLTLYDWQQFMNFADAQWNVGGTEVKAPPAIATPGTQSQSP